MLFGPGCEASPMRLPLTWSCVLLCVGWLLCVLSLYVCGSSCVLWSPKMLLNVAVLFVCACCRGSFIELCWAWSCLRSCSRVLLLFCLLLGQTRLFIGALSVSLSFFDSSSRMCTGWR